VYFLVVGLCLFLFPLFGPQLPPDFPVSVSTAKLNPWFYATFTGNFDYIYNGITNILIGILWSVSVEEQFYLFWPLLIAFIPKKYLLPAFITVILGSIAFRFWGSQGGNGLILKYHSLSSMSDLATGALLALCCTYQTFVDKVKNTPRWLIVSLYVLFFVIIGFRRYIWKFGLYYVHAAAILPVIFSLLFAFFIMEQNYAERSFYKIGNFKRISSLGKYTYGMYCYHMIIFFLVLYTLYTCGINVAHLHKYLFMFVLIISMICTILFSKFSYRYIESSFLKLKNRFATIIK